jgi:hypothetical protein
MMFLVSENKGQSTSGILEGGHPSALGTKPEHCQSEQNCACGFAPFPGQVDERIPVGPMVLV